MQQRAKQAPVPALMILMLSNIPPQLEKNQVVPQSFQDEAHARPKNTLFPQDRAVPLWGRGGVGRLRMRWWASSPPAAPRDSTRPSSQAVVPLLRARGIQGASCSGVHHTHTVSLRIRPRQLSCSHGSQNKVLTSRPRLQLSTAAPHAAHLSRTRWIPGSSLNVCKQF